MTAAKAKSGRLSISKAKLAEMVEEATVDAYGESEQVTGWFTMIEDNLAVPFETKVLGVRVTVERVDLDPSEQIVAVCRRGRERLSHSILDLPLPAPPPAGAEWIVAYRMWRTGGEGGGAAGPQRRGGHVSPSARPGRRRARRSKGVRER